MQKTIFILFIPVLFSACYYDKKSELFPGSGLNACDTLSTITYSRHVSAILSSYCYACHSGPTPTAQVDLTTWASVSVYVNNGQLIGTVKHLTGFNQMPPSGPIDRCKIRQIELWVNAGAPNN